MSEQSNDNVEEYQFMIFVSFFTSMLLIEAYR